jgi:hypothetical protein
LFWQKLVLIRISDTSQSNGARLVRKCNIGLDTSWAEL